ncbi:MFS general substrate transporter [Epithele typhae]|uniref:MFS general substrate transporter n=1 Tax=Epithele typhae TaxID=378194 RepID=UPI002007B8AE|nr:MFS general substrate transporter [Epithele typhae]KAH9927461.1 MFS general substrate transporter [Epithele typhae]
MQTNASPPSAREVIRSTSTTNVSNQGLEKAADGRADRPRRPFGLRWRSSVWFITLGVFVDILIYSLIVPVIPFRLQDLGYDGVSGLVGWLLFAYSAALVISTPPIAHLTELYKNRRTPLLLGQGALIAAQIMLMEAPKYWLMVLARIAQGVSASVIWVVGLALVCDTVPSTIVGKQLGFVAMGASFGFVVGPPVSGALNDRFGFRGPFIFGIIVTFIEFMCRVLIIERKEAERWDASLSPLVRTNTSSSRRPAYGGTSNEKRDEPAPTDVLTAPADADAGLEAPSGSAAAAAMGTDAAAAQTAPQLSIVRLLWLMVKSKRTMAPVLLAFVYGAVLTSQEPVVPLYLGGTYGLDTSQIGLVYIAAVIPSFICKPPFPSPLSGWWADKHGATSAVLISVVCSLPFFFLIAIKSSLAYFIVMIALESFFFYGTLSPVTAELAAVTQSLDGVGYGHSYGAFNIAYGLGSAVGPVIGGQIYDHASNGWMIVNFFDAGLAIAAVVFCVFCFGEEPLSTKIVRRLRKRSSSDPEAGLEQDEHTTSEPTGVAEVE